MSNTKFTRTLKDLDDLLDSEIIKSKKFEDFPVTDLKKLSSDDLRSLYKNKINEFHDFYLKTKEILPDETVTRFEESEIKKMTKKMTAFRDQCQKNGLSVREFEEESVEFITDKYKRFFFNSKLAQRLYKINNSVASTSLGYWGYRAVGALGSTNRFLLKTELLKSFLPITYFTGVTLKFWSYIAAPFPSVSEVLDGLSSIAMSPIWGLEYILNQVTAPLWKRSPVKVPIPLNISGEVASGYGLTWDKLTHTFNFVQNMTKNWTDE